MSNHDKQVGVLCNINCTWDLQGTRLKSDVGVSIDTIREAMEHTFGANEKFLI